MPSPVTTYVTNVIQTFLKYYIKGWEHLNLRPNNTLFSRLQPIIHAVRIAALS